MRILISAILFAGLLAGCATTSAPPTHSAPAVEAANAEQSEGPTVRMVTGSRIPQRVTADGKVMNNSSSPVIVYDRKALDRTGYRDAATAVGFLHPQFY